jgi:hypothetical protein
MRLACSSKVPDELASGAFAGEAAAVLGEYRDAWAKQGAADHRDQRDAVHEVEHLRRIGLARAGLCAAEQRIAAGYCTVG